jgi:hypothetical protein
MLVSEAGFSRLGSDSRGTRPVPWRPGAAAGNAPDPVAGVNAPEPVAGVNAPEPVAGVNAPVPVDLGGSDLVTIG